MTSSDAGAISNSIISPIVPSLMPTLSNAPSLTLSPVLTTRDNLIHRPFTHGLLRLARPRQQSIDPDRLGAFDRTLGKERDPDRGGCARATLIYGKAAPRGAVEAARTRFRPILMT